MVDEKCTERIPGNMDAAYYLCTNKMIGKKGTKIKVGVGWGKPSNRCLFFYFFFPLLGDVKQTLFLSLSLSLSLSLLT